MDLLLNRWLLVPGPRLPGLGPVGVLPVGRRVRLPRPAPGRHGPGPRRARGGAGPHPPRGGPPVRRGGRAALVAPAGRPRRPHPLLRRLPLAAPTSPATTSTTTGDAAILDELVPFLTGPGAEAGPGGRLRPAGRRGRPRHAVRPLRPRARARAAARRARPAADGHRRLERRHEPGRRRGPGRERLGRLVPDRHPARASPTLAEARGDADRAAAVAGRPSRSAPPSRSTPGTAAGIAAPSSTTARRSARRGTTSARSTRSPSPGP